MFHCFDVIKHPFISLISKYTFRWFHVWITFYSSPHRWCNG